MESFIYSVWFRDTAASPEDQDRDWVASISIQALTHEQAQEWGDTLARERIERTPGDIFISSSVEPEPSVTNMDMRSLPRIVVGQRPADETLGW